ncbi:MAG: hypothetical protein JNK05_13300 [Myxococcales bacterium]|nr:hypothetical protein [Myxococcales bacterium]
MNPVRLDLTIVIEAGSLRRELPLSALAAALGRVPLHELRTTLLGLLRDAFPRAPWLSTWGEPTEGVRSEAFVRSERTERKEIYKPERSNVRTGSPCARGNAPLSTERSDIAMLAELLDDPSGELALRKLVDRHPRAVIEHALRRTLAVPRSHIKRSRAAYFTALVRALDSHSHSSSSPYDPSSPPAPS